ncbi:serine hydrolase domain-containing protein [Ekhidna sp. MALMAid0563]|uniref:serine hydrolase domain-containing protein n=1 Tax=Ekhidna sp. MALMAid0563 TaxID=3143937 RepID=UPI0032DEA7AE
MKRHFLFSLLFVFTSILHLSYAQSDQAIQAALDSIQKAAEYPGVVFTYIDTEGDVHAFASGMADKENDVSMTINHKLHGGSTGKTVVSAVVMQLVGEGKLSLDDKVSKYLGSNDWYSRLANAEDITVRHLLQHSSGIIRYEFKEEFLNDLAADPSRIWKPEELLTYVLDDEPPFAVGEGFTYSDTNYILLGMIIEKITNNTFYEEAEERVLKPLGINSFTPTNTTFIPNMAQGYYTEGSEYALGFKAPFLVDGKAQNNMQFEWTGGGYVYENADYARLLKSIYEGDAFDMEALEEEFFDYADAEEIGGMYGLGIIKYEFPGLGTFIGHSGFFPGYNTAGFYHPDTGEVFTMQINSTNEAQLQRFFGSYLGLVRMIMSE